MSTGLLDRILDLYGENLIQAAMAHWGEPLVNKRFPELVKRVKSFDVFVDCSTNLSVPIDETRVYAIVESGLDSMRMSIDGATQETYAKYRVKGDLDLVIKNIKQLVAAKAALGVSTPLLRWQFLQFPWNAHETEDAKRMAADLGVDDFITPRGDLWGEVDHEIWGRKKNLNAPRIDAVSLDAGEKQIWIDKTRNENAGAIIPH